MKKLVDDACRNRCTSACSSCAPASTSTCSARPRTRSRSMLRQYGHDYKAQAGRRRGAWSIDGAVRAMVGGRDYGASQFNRATDALRQPGSSFKPYVYATALMQRLQADLDRGRRADLHRQLVPAELFGGSFSGSMTLTQALTRSINVIPVRLSIALGNGNPEDRPRQDHPDSRSAWACARRCPTRRRCRSAPTKSPCSTTPAAMRPSPMAARRSTPHAVLEVRSGTGELIWRFDRDGKKPVQVIRPQVALDMNMMMNKVVEEGTGRRAHPRRHQVGRQDRHHQRLSRRLVRRLHRQLCRAASGSATTTTRRPTA